MCFWLKNMSVVEPSSPRNTGRISDSEGAAANTSLVPPQMEATQGQGQGQAQAQAQCPLILDLVRKFQELSLDDPQSPEQAEQMPKDDNSKTQVPIPKDIELKQTVAPVPEVIPPKLEPVAPVAEIIAPKLETVAPAPEIAAPDSVKDANYFLKVLHDEQTRMLAAAVRAERYTAALATDGNISEDVLGMLRSATGSARLLVKSKLNQFEDLCKSNLNPSPDGMFPITNDDLEGFWDMVNLQVSQLDADFAAIEKMKANSWQLPAQPSTSPATNAGVKKAKSKTGASTASKTSLCEQWKRSTERRLALVKARQAADK